MRTLTIELPSHAAQSEFNLRRWEELLADPEIAKLEFRVETDRYGNVIMSPPPAPNHGELQSTFSWLLRNLMRAGSVLSECPISTADGVRAADVAWASPTRKAELGNRSCFPHAPEVCVEVRSPKNSEAEIQEKIALYLDAGAEEVWVCDCFGNVSFFGRGGGQLARSAICPEFPSKVDPNSR